MDKPQKYQWIKYFVLCSLPTIVIGIGAWNAPSEFNMASWCLWIVISSPMFWALNRHDYLPWRESFGYPGIIICLVVIMFARGGYTWNVGWMESVILGVAVIGMTAFVAQRILSSNRNYAYLWLAGLIAETASFYPQIKQYWGNHDAVSAITLSGWILWLGLALFAAYREAVFNRRCAENSQASQTKIALYVMQESLLSFVQIILISLSLLCMVLA